MSVRGRWVSWLLAASLIAFGGLMQAQASVVEALDLAALVADADTIVVAKAVAEQSHYDEYGRIVTDVEMLVERSEKGATAGESIVVRRLGGVINGLGMRIEGEPSFTLGERTLLFGKKLRDALRPVGMSQGALRVLDRDGESWVRSAAAGLALLRRAPDGTLTKAQAALSSPRRLEDVLSEIRALVAKSSGR